MDSNILKEIEGIFPKHRILTELSERYSYSFDASFGQYLPELVVQPQSVEQIARLVRLANERRIPLYPRGSATSLSGGPLPVQGGIEVDISTSPNRLDVAREMFLDAISHSVDKANYHQKS